MDIQSGYDDILKQGNTLFFPEGTSSKGQESDFEFKVSDFRQNTLPKVAVIDNIYNTVKLSILRFYLATKQKLLLSEESDDELNFITGVSEQAAVPAYERPTLKFTRDRNQLDSINEPHNSHQEVVFMSEESIESTITSANAASTLR